MKLLQLPTWLLVRLMTPILPSTHPWKNKKFTLQEWTNGATDMSLALSILLWGNSLALLFMIIFLIVR